MNKSLTTFNDSILSLIQEKEDQNKVLCYLQNTSAASSKLLLTAKPLSLDPNGGQGQLTTASRSLMDALNKLLTFCSASRLVLKECEGALRDVQVWMLVESIRFHPKFNHRFSIGLGELSFFTSLPTTLDICFFCTPHVDAFMENELLI